MNFLPIRTALNNTRYKNAINLVSLKSNINIKKHDTRLMRKMINNTR